MVVWAQAPTEGTEREEIESYHRVGLVIHWKESELEGAVKDDANPLARATELILLLFTDVENKGGRQSRCERDYMLYVADCTFQRWLCLYLFHPSYSSVWPTQIPRWDRVYICSLPLNLEWGLGQNQVMGSSISGRICRTNESVQASWSLNSELSHAYFHHILLVKVSHKTSAGKE